jgi:hypothetical protein
MVPCDHVITQLWEYIDGGMGAEDAAKIQAPTPREFECLRLAVPQMSTVSIDGLPLMCVGSGG